MAEEPAPRYCPRCAAPLELRPLHGRARPACPHCAFVHFEDPKVAVGVLVEDTEGQLLYTKRNHDPRMGEWALPSGFVDRGEELQEAAVREVREETGLAVALSELIGVYSRRGDPVIFVVYAGRPIGGELAPGAEAQEVRFFPPAQLPPPAFPFDGEIITAWRRARGSR